MLLQESIFLNDVFDEGHNPLNKRKSTRKQRRVKREKSTPNISLYMRKIQPKTKNQEKAFRSYFEGQEGLLFHGSAGVGKTFLALFLSLSDVLNNIEDKKKVIIVRSAQSGRDVGFLPGKLEDKMKVFEAPYYEACANLFGRGDAYDILKKNGVIEFHSTSFLRGTSYSDSIIIADEIQNFTQQEIHTIMTRVGENSRIILCGDFRQSDLPREKDREGLFELFNILKHMGSVDRIEFTTDDIVRSGFVKDYLIACEKIKDGIYI